MTTHTAYMTIELAHLTESDPPGSVPIPPLPIFPVTRDGEIIGHRGDPAQMLAFTRDWQDPGPDFTVRWIDLVDVIDRGHHHPEALLHGLLTERPYGVFGHTSENHTREVMGDERKIMTVTLHREGGADVRYDVPGPHRRVTEEPA